MTIDNTIGTTLKKPSVEIVNGLKVTNDNGVLIIEPVGPSADTDTDFVRAFNEAQKHFDELRSMRVREIILHVNGVTYTIRQIDLPKLDTAIEESDYKTLAKLTRDSER